MDRFELEEIIDQDSSGIVYRATDRETKKAVAIHRFFPFGNEGGGLDSEESDAFTSAAKKLADSDHPALRSIILAAVDPIDHIPFIVTEWVDGSPLDQLIFHEKLGAAHTMDVLRLAIEISIQLSEVLGEEAVWVETEPDSIVVDSDESGRGFTFSMSPFKWLNPDPNSKDLSGLADLAEELMGWKKKLYNAQAGHGLGGWVKRLKKQPDLNLSEVLASLDAVVASASSSEKGADLAVAPVGAPTPAVTALVQKKRSKKPVLLALVTLSVIAGTLFYVSRPETKSEELAETTETDLQDEIPKPTEEKIEAAAERNFTEQVSTELNTETPPEETSTKAEEPISQGVVVNETPPAKKLTGPELLRQRNDAGLYFPQDKLAFTRVKPGVMLRLQGTLTDVAFSKSKKHLYLLFESEPKGYVLGVIKFDKERESGLRGKLGRLVGKEITISGKKVNDGTNRRLVRFNSLEDIQVTESTEEE